MQDQSSILSLPLIQPSQAQKHVTHNEALRILDVLVQLAVIDRDRTSPPDDPAPGDRHIVGTGATGAWSGADLRIAIWEEGGWGFLDPRPGWRAVVLSEARGLVFDGTGWVVRLPELDNLPGLGLNTSADATNRLAVAASATLLTHEGAGHQLKINKAIPTDTSSLLFQTGFSGRAEMGTAGNDDWSIKVSPDGIAWIEALRVEAATGRITGQAVQSAPTDTAAGRLMRADFGYGPGNLLGPVAQVGGTPTGAVIEHGSNANGDFVRFADGTQICLVSSNLGPVTAFGSGTFADPYSTTSDNFNWPALFAVDTTPFTACNGRVPAASIGREERLVAGTVRGADRVAARQCTVTRIGDITTGQDGWIDIIGIGRWF
jgi:hypothetical protein